MAGAEPGPCGTAGLLVVLLTALPAGAQESTPAVEAGADTVRQAGPGEKAAADSVQQADGRLSPRAALVRSAVLPGWGQAATGHGLKALLFAGAGAGWLTSAIVESARVGDAPTPQDHEDRAARRNTRVLFYLVTATLSALDVYVDAHLENFQLDAGDPETPGVRLKLRWGP